MLLTEEQAREKFCCQMHTIVHAPAGERNCIASDCMAWRWGPSAYFDDESDALREYQHYTAWPEIKRGYCGLAGKAE